MNDQSSSTTGPEPDDLAAALATLRLYAATHNFDDVAAWMDREHAEAREARGTREHLGPEFDRGWVAASVCMAITRQISREVSR